MKQEAFKAEEAIPANLEAIANELQIALMPIAYGEQHPSETIDMSDGSIRNTVAQEWMQAHAAAFREYIDEHPQEVVDLRNEHSLLEFFAKLKETETLH